jgi:hypothetical protein
VCTCKYTLGGCRGEKKRDEERREEKRREEKRREEKKRGEEIWCIYTSGVSTWTCALYSPLLSYSHEMRGSLYYHKNRTDLRTGLTEMKNTKTRMYKLTYIYVRAYIPVNYNIQYSTHRPL